LEFPSNDILWSERLNQAIDTVNPVREFLIEGFLYKKSIQMIYAPDGAGKSLITLQATMQGTVSDSKVFGEFYVKEGFKTLYVQAERSVDENLERMRLMKSKTPFDSKNFVLDTDLQGINLKNDSHADAGINHIIEVCASSFLIPDLIVLDPIYAMVRGGLKDDEGASYITDFSRRIQKYFGCSIILVHHANRGSRDVETGKRGNEDMFGSRFLSAHCTGVYKMTLKEEGMGSVLTREKTSNENLEKKIELWYDPESGLSWVSADKKTISKTDKLFNFLRTCKVQQKTFNFKEMMVESGLSKSGLLKVLGSTLSSTPVLGSVHPSGELKEVSKSIHGSILYQYV